MDPERFDRLAASFGKRISRRDAMKTGVIGVGGVTLAGVTSSTLAHDATPEASPVALDTDTTSFMFVQTFGAGSIDAATDGVETLLLVADHLAGQTLFFSDRPERIVGMVPTEAFLTGGKDGEGLGFTPADPPNAALVLPNGKTLVVELIDPQYDPATGQVRYQLRVLEDVTQVDLHLESEMPTREEVVGEFTAASLFIDDCPTATSSVGGRPAPRSALFLRAAVLGSAGIRATFAAGPANRRPPAMTGMPAATLSSEPSAALVVATPSPPALAAARSRRGFEVHESKNPT
jgi:hypothetical protein